MHVEPGSQTTALDEPDVAAAPPHPTLASAATATILPMTVRAVRTIAASTRGSSSTIQLHVATTDAFVTDDRASPLRGH
jgi:hypothetical protein